MSRTNKIILRATPAGEFYFLLKSGNGQINLTSVVVGKREEINGVIKRTKELIRDSKNIRILKTDDNEPYFIITKNDEVFAKSRIYNSRASLDDGLRSVRRNIENCIFVDFMAETI